MTQSQPPITRTTHTLPFDKLSPRDFERLCLWLVEREGYERAEHLGAAGSEQGRDIVAWREGALWAFQCKRVRNFGPKDALVEIEKVLALPEAERPVGLVLLITCDVSVNTRQQARERCAGETECHFWAGTELDERVKRHPEIVEGFFGLAREARPPITRTTHLLPFDRLYHRDFERLCLWLVEREGYERAEHLGVAGGEEGRDIIAWREGELWAFQCKRVRNLSAGNALMEVEKILALPEAQHPAGVAFLVTCDVSTMTRDRVSIYCKQHDLACQFWALTELHERASRHPDLLQEFFGWDTADLSRLTPPETTTMHVLPLEQLSLQDFRELCLRLFDREGYRFLQIKPIDAAGETQGYFIACTEKSHPEPGTWIFEWLEHHLRDSVSPFIIKIDGIHSLSRIYPVLSIVSGVHFIQSGIIPAPIRTRIQAHCSSAGLKVRFWALTELDQLAKRHPDIIEDYFSLGRLNTEFEPAGLYYLFAQCQDPSLSPYEKGKALENLSVALFEPCFDVDSNLRSETGEVDLWLERTITTPFWTDYGAIAIAECKNRSADYPVNSAEVSVLIDKCTNHDSKLGFLVSLGPFTQDALVKIRDQNVRRGSLSSPLVVPVRREDIEELVQYGGEIEDRLRMLVRAARQDKKGFYRREFNRKRASTG